MRSQYIPHVHTYRHTYTRASVHLTFSLNKTVENANRMEYLKKKTFTHVQYAYIKGDVWAMCFYMHENGATICYMIPLHLTLLQLLEIADWINESRFRLTRSKSPHLRFSRIAYLIDTQFVITRSYVIHFFLLFFICFWFFHSFWIDFCFEFIQTYKWYFPFTLDLLHKICHISFHYISF